MVFIIGLLATIGASLMSFDLLANNRGKIHLSQESLTNSRIEHEENKSITSSFLPTEQKAHDFENREHKIIIFVTCGILLFLVTLGFASSFGAVVVLVVLENVREPEDKISIGSSFMQIYARSIMEQN